MSDRQYAISLLVVCFLVLLWSAASPKDYFIWLLEVFPVLMALPVLIASYCHFTMSRLTYLMILCHAIILMIGGHYTYSEVPLFDWVRDAFDFERNHYDRVGHIAQGFFPAIISREILLRLSPLQPGKWLFFIICCIALAISAFYEIIEWWVAVTTGSQSEAFLAQQGDIWDTQWDMFLALCGAITAQFLLVRTHDRSMARLSSGL
jgi:putative membrane protein